jgi:hypothetical protein
MPPSLPHAPDPMALMIGLIFLVAFIATLIRDDEEWQRQAVCVYMTTFQTSIPRELDLY